MSNKQREKDEKSAQAYAALCVGFVCVAIGLPLWWKTTQTYRAQLPYSQISELTSTAVKYKAYFTVIVLDDTLDNAALSRFGEKMRGEFQTEGDGRFHASYEGNIRRAYEDEKQAYNAAKTIQELDATLEKERLLKEAGKYSLVLLPKGTTILSGTNIIGFHRCAYLLMDTDLDSLLPVMNRLMQDFYVDEDAMKRAIQMASGARHLQTDKESMRSVRYHHGYEVTFTLLNPQPDILNAHLDVRGAVKKYLKPFLTSLGDYSQITVKSQYLHYINLNISPRKDSSGSYYVLKLENLPHIINPMEAYLSSHVSNNPNLNFILYIPTRDQSPLHIHDSQDQKSTSNAFLSPRWGGVLVYNVPGPGANVSLPADVEVDTRSVMEVFVSQLRLLLGINPKLPIEGFKLEQPVSSALPQWELDRWLRSRTLENVATGSATLQSLVQLLEEVGNIVITDEIAAEVERALTSLIQSQTYLSQGKLKEAFLSSRQAMISSEKAFFDPSLLELLYFPEDQKFAIYIPLFLPISIPVVLSLIQAFKWMRNKDQVEKED